MSKNVAKKRIFGKVDEMDKFPEKFYPEFEHLLVGKCKTTKQQQRLLEEQEEEDSEENMMAMQLSKYGWYLKWKDARATHEKEAELVNLGRSYAGSTHIALNCMSPFPPLHPPLSFPYRFPYRIMPKRNGHFHEQPFGLKEVFSSVGAYCNTKYQHRIHFTNKNLKKLRPTLSTELLFRYFLERSDCRHKKIVEHTLGWLH